MTNNEKANEISEHYATSRYFPNDKEMAAYDAAEQMAEWKDEQFSIERKQLIEKVNQAVTQLFENGAIFKKQQVIEKACEFLSKRVFSYDGNFIEDFKKAMEEQQ